MAMDIRVKRRYGSGRAANSTPAPDVHSAAWKTALAEAAKGKGPLTSAFPSNIGPTGCDVVRTGHDHGYTTSLAVFGNATGPQGMVFVDPYTKEATVTHLNPLTGRPASEPETVKDVGGKLVAPPGVKVTTPNDMSFWSVAGGINTPHAQFDIYGTGGHQQPDITVAISDGPSVVNGEPASGIRADILTPATGNHRSRQGKI
jgi:hypothetical protein